MTTRSACLLIFFLTALAVRTVRADDARKVDQGTFLGVLCAPRKEPASSPGATGKSDKADKAKPARGVLVTHVLPASPAARADLRKGDILLEYDRQAIRDGDHLAHLIRADKPSRKVQLRYQRGKDVKTAEATLTLGPALNISGDPKAASARANELHRGSVSVWAAPLASGKMKFTIEYYATGKLRTLTCEGAGAELAATLRKLPERERDLVRIALRRLRTLNTLPPPRIDSSSPPVKR
jgi:hypothetical protein